MTTTTHHRNPEAAAQGLDVSAAKAMRIAVGAVGAASLSDDDITRGLLGLSDETLGRLFKQGLIQFQRLLESDAVQRLIESGVTGGVGGLDVLQSLIVLRGLSAEPARTIPAGHAETGVNLDEFEKSATSTREALVRAGELLPAAEMWTKLGITRQGLSKAVKAGNYFTVDVGPKAYYPAFYTSTDIDRKALTSVSALLGQLPGWSKWQFFTTRKGSLGDVTPLDALRKGKLESVQAAAKAFAER